MRLPWRAAEPERDLSPEMRAWIDARASLPEADRDDIERARMVVQARIAGAASAPRGSVRRRLALGGLGGGALWSGLAGFASAHQAVSVAVGVGLLVAGSTAAEVAGLRPAVTEYVAERIGDGGADEARLDSTSTAVAASNVTASAVSRVASQLVLEGTLEGISSASLTVRRAEDDVVTLPLGPHFVALGLDGHTQAAPDLVGLRVVVAADCGKPTSGGAGVEDCEARLVRAVRSQGQGGAGGAPGQSGDAPGHGGTTPGQSEDAPGQGGTTPGRSEDAPGQTGDTPVPAGDPPGQGDNPPGQGGDPPGQGGDPPGQGGDPAGQSGDPPGQSGSSPGQSGDPPGQGGDPPGQAGDPPGQGGGNGGSGGNGNGPPN
jgi:hypothetical protein